MSQPKRFLLMLGILLAAITLVLRGNVLVGAAPAAQSETGRLVIKNGDLTMEVMDTDAEVRTALNLALTYNAYILQQRVWDGDQNYRYAEIQFGVQAAEFEHLVQAFKNSIEGTVLDETATGQDVTDIVTDLESRLANLYETQARMRTFLEQARNVTETLKVHDELVEIETEIGTLQGQMNYHENRAAAATLTLHLRPFMPTPTPTLTSTATPTPTPTPLPGVNNWQPGVTAHNAGVRFANTFFDVADGVLYLVIAVAPWLFLLGLVLFAGQRVYRKRERPFVPPPTPPAPEA